VTLTQKKLYLKARGSGDKGFKVILSSTSKFTRGWGLSSAGILSCKWTKNQS
jgi:hypothetical protein